MRKTISLFCLMGILLSCNQPRGPIFVGDPPPPPPRSAERICADFIAFDHEKKYLIAATQAHENAGLFVQELLQLEQTSPFLFKELLASDNAEYTLLLPSDVAMKDFNRQYDWSSISQKSMESIIKTHVLIDAAIYRNLLDDLPVASNMDNHITRFSRDDEDCIVVNEQAKLLQVDDRCKNGVIHIIDRVIIPDDGI